MSPAVPAPNERQRRQNIERDLNGLRNDRRLAIHMNELGTSQALSPEHYHFNAATWNNFDTPPDQIHGKLLQSTYLDSALPLLSMSLLPSGEKSIKPYSTPVIRAFAGTYGYLVDLRQEQEFLAPRLVGASMLDMDSGFKANYKDFWDRTYQFLQSLPGMTYAEHDGDRWVHDCGGPKGAELTNTLLDKIDSNYKDLSRLNSVQQHGKYTMDFFGANEIIVAASQEHIRAITIPVCDEPLGDENSLYAPLARLAGALVGLQHLNQHIDLPVVFYHLGNVGLANIATVEDETGAKRGDITYLGQGRQELLKIALDAIETMQSREVVESHTLNQLQTVAQEVLDIDIRRPLSEQNTVVGPLRSESAVGAGRYEG